MVLAMGLVASSHSVGQATVPGNNGGPPDYLGWDSNTGLPLRVMNNGNEPIQWFTDSIQRMQLYRTQTNTINGFSLIDQSGFVGISARPNFFTASIGPFSRLHLVDAEGTNNASTYAQQIGFRPWQRNGITMTGNSDQCYVGQKYNGADDNSDLVLQWSDNPGNAPWGTDRLRFLFTSWSQGAPYGARSREGLESFRVFVPNDTIAFVGIGDWNKATVLNNGTAVDPDEQLDVLERTIRIRRLVPDYENDTLNKVVVTDDDGRLHWRLIDDLSGADCDWVVQTSEPHVSNVYDGSSCDWDMSHGVGIGEQIPKFKLHVYHTNDELLDPTVIYGDARFDLGTGHVIGVFGQARPTAVLNGSIYSTNATGVIGRAYNYRWTTGVEGYASTAQAAFLGCQDLIGVKGIADAGENAIRSIGVYGSATGGYASTWGGYFEGRGFLGASAWTYSDANLKEGVEDLDPQAMINATAT